VRKNRWVERRGHPKRTRIHAVGVGMSVRKESFPFSPERRGERTGSGGHQET